MKRVKIKRSYEPFEKEDGFRVLVDRLWPRGMKKENAQVDLWMKQVAPSAELRKWFGHDPARWNLFQQKYKRELKQTAALEDLQAIVAEHKKVSLLFSAKDEQHNHAVILQQMLQ